MSEKKPTDIPVTQKEEKDMFHTFADMFINNINEATRTQTQYVAALTNIQQEYIDMLKKVSESYANVLKAEASNLWGPVRIPAALNKAITDSVDITTRITDINNKAILSVLELIRQNIKVFNDNIDSFTKLNINFIKLWSSILTPRL